MKKIGLLLTLIYSLITIMVSAATPAYAAEPTINFSGRIWNVRMDAGGPGPNVWNAGTDSVFVDVQGQLHLKVINKNGVWYSSEVYLPSSLGYGTYSFDIASHVDQTDTNLVASPFLYQDDSHEIDIEFSNWQYPGDDIAQYVVQPYSKSGNMKRFPLQLTDSVSSYSYTWSPNGIAFSSSQNNSLISQWNYTGTSNFVPGGEQLHINFWMINGLAPSDGQTKEFIVKSFKFTPLGSTSTVTAPTTIVSAPVSASTTMIEPTTSSPTSIAPSTTSAPTTSVTTAVTTAVASSTPAPAPSNLVPNPTLITSADSSTPDAWNRGGWGSNIRTLLNSVTGPNGERALQTNISGYLDGDAKWYFNPISVQAGNTYAFQDLYNANVPTTVTLQYTMSDGSNQYVDLTSLPSTNGGWNTAQAAFTVPAGATQVTVFHYINQVGTLTIAVVSLTRSSGTTVSSTTVAPAAPITTTTAPVASTTTSAPSTNTTVTSFPTTSITTTTDPSTITTTPTYTPTRKHHRWWGWY